MKISFATLTLAAALFTGSASAMTESAPLNSVIGLSGVSVYYTLNDGVATLKGDVKSLVESALAQSHVEKIEGVDKVVNRITIK